MKTLNKILLTSLITAGSFGIFGKSYGQNKNLDSAYNEVDKRIRLMDRLEFLEKKEKIEEFENKQRYPELYSKKLYSDTLKINLNDGIYYITKKDEKSGIEDIRKINNNYEEAWLFLPEKQIWYETGIYSDSNSTFPFPLRIGDALKENQEIKELIFYHNHPGESYNKPSINDMRHLFGQNFDYLGYKITGKIVADKGVVEYSLNSKGKELLEKAKKNPIDLYCVDLTGIDKYFDINCVEYKK